MKYLITYLICLVAFASSAQTKIEILRADELVYDRAVGLYQMCVGNVKFKQGNMYMDCDSARFYEEINRIEAFGNIYIRQKDTVDLWGKYLEYDGDLRMARVSENVRLKDKTMTLKTDALTYDMTKKIGYYTTGGNIDNGRDKLYSKRGTYYSRSKEFFFKDSVRLFNEEYTMKSDTLKYNTVSKTAYFYGPTYINSEENTIFCNYGWYNTEKEYSQFSQGAYIEGKENKLLADSMVYNRITGLGQAFCNILFTDTIQDLTVIGDYGRYDRTTSQTMITDHPMAIINIDGDSLYLKADTLFDYADSLSGRRLIAFHNTTIYKSDFQGVSDSMAYHFHDSTITMYVDPILWTDSNQITGDTITVFRGSEGIEKLVANENGFIIEKDVNSLYNQIKGNKLDANFVEGKLNTVLVTGSGQSLYYALEEGKQYSGVNDIVCGSMRINIDSTNKARTITFYSQPKATFYPLEALPTGKSRLEGFVWHAMLRPRIDTH